MLRKFRLANILLMLSLLASMVGAQEMLLRETFQGGDGERPQGWSFDTTSDEFWTLGDGWLHTGEGRNLITADGYSFAIAEPPGSEQWSDYSVSTEFYYKSEGGQVCLIGRWQDRENFYMGVFEVVELRRVLRLVKRERGQDSDLARLIVEPGSTNPVATLGIDEAAAPVQFGLQFEGGNLTLVLAGQPVLRAADTSFLQGRAGLGLRYADVAFNLFEVRPGAAMAGGLGLNAPGDQAYRVRVISTKNLVQAQNIEESLRRQGYFPTLIEEDGYHKVFVGQFASEAEALKLQAHLVSENYALARVTLVDRGSPETPEARRSVEEKLEESEVFQSSEWRNLTPDQQRKVIETMSMQQAMRTQNQSLEEILELKKLVNELSEKQVSIIHRMDSAEQQREQQRRAISRLVHAIRRAKDAQKWDEALALLDQLEQLDPNSPIADRERSVIEHKKAGTFEGSDILAQQKREQLEQMQAEAETLQSRGDIEGALNMWRNIRSTGIDDPELVQKADQKAQSLRTILEQQRADEAKAREASTQRQLILYVGGAFGVAVLLIVVFYVIGRRREKRMLRQLHEEAIAPLQALQANAGRLPGGSEGEIDFQQQPGLLDQGDSPDAEFMIPETDDAAEEESGDDGVGENLDPLGGLADDEAPEFEIEAPEDEGSAEAEFEIEEPAPAEAPEPAAEGKDEDEFSMDFGIEEPAEESSVLPPAEEAPSGGDDEQIAFDFGEDEAPGEMTDAPITAQEVQPAAESGEESEIVFSFDDETSQGEPEAPAPEPIAAGPGDEAPAESDDDSIYESIPLDDLNLELGGGEDEKTAVSPPAGESPASGGDEGTVDSSMDLDFDLDLPAAPEAETKTPEAPPEPAPEAPPAPEVSDDSLPAFDFGEDSLSDVQIETPDQAPPAEDETVADAPAPAEYETVAEAPSASTADAGAAGLALALDQTPEGEKPEGWAGKNNEVAALSVAPDPDGGGKCLQYKKTGSGGPTGYRLSFPAISGKIVIEFDIRCDEKNKHLLGFYVEEDGDFRRSINTVVQCLDPSSPAHLRISTKPTPYQMGQWRSVKYLVDLDESLVDGYVDGQLVNEGWRMGTKVEKLNTLSIRDDKESTGTLYLRNIRVQPAG